MFNALNFAQEKLKREKLEKDLERKSVEREEKMQQAFVRAVDMQQKAQEEAAALKTELAQTTRNGQREIDVLTVQVGEAVVFFTNLKFE